MSQAEALLNSLETTSVTYAGRTAEEHIVIGDDRIIRVPDALKRLGVEHDHDIETVTFDCPRYWDEHDMSQMKIYINYLCPDGNKGQYAAKNLKVGYDQMSFDWTISNNVTMVKGPISFLVCIKRTNAEGNEENHWNSELNQECYISEGLECDEIALVAYPDIITHLLTRMEEVEAIATPEAMQSYTAEWLEANHDLLLAEIDAKAAEALASIPEDYSTTSANADEAIKTKADAIVLSAEGDNAVVMTDSSDDYLRGLRIFGKTTQVTTTGKNLANPDEILPLGFASSLKAPILGYDENEYRILCIPATPGTIYTVSRGAVLGSRFRYGFTVDYPASGGEIHSDSTAYASTYDSAKKFTTIATPEGYNYLLVYLTNSNSTEHVENTWYQVEEGAIATEYEPYSAGIPSPDPMWSQDLVNAGNVTVSIQGKNLALCSTAYSNTLSGLTVDIAEGASEVTLNGTTEKSFSIVLMKVGPLPRGTYTLSSLGFNHHDASFDRLYVMNFDTEEVLVNYVLEGIPKAFSLTEPTTITISVVFKTGSEYINRTAKVQLEFTDHRILSGTSTSGSIIEPNATEYEPGVAAQTALFDRRQLLGIPVGTGGNYTDADGQQWLCDELDFERKKFIRRVWALRLTGAESITREERSGGTYRFIIRPDTPVRGLSLSGGYCTHFPINVAPIGLNDVDKAAYVWTTGIAYIRWDDVTDADQLKAVLTNSYNNGNPVVLYYPLETPEESDLSLIELRAFEPLHSNYPSTTVYNNAGTHMVVKYNADTKTYVDNSIKASVTDVLEAIENGYY